MNLIKRSWLIVLLLLFVGAGTCFAQSRIQLVNGKRAIADKVSFVVEVAPDPRYPTPPLEGIYIFTRFQDHPATGKLYLDGQAVARFDESMGFNSNLIDAKYGRHTLTMAFASPSAIGDFMVSLRGPGIAREILDEPALVRAGDRPSQRVTELEHKISNLEAEIATLKKKRAQ